MDDAAARALPSWLCCNHCLMTRPWRGRAYLYSALALKLSCIEEPLQHDASLQDSQSSSHSSFHGQRGAWQWLPLLLLGPAPHDLCPVARDPFVTIMIVHEVAADDVAHGAKLQATTPQHITVSARQCNLCIHAEGAACLPPRQSASYRTYAQAALLALGLCDAWRS